MFEEVFDIKIIVRRYIECIKIKHDYWLDIHDKLEDLFTTIKNRFQDISHT